MLQVAGAGSSQSAAPAQCGTCAEAAETKLAVQELLQKQLTQVRPTPHAHTRRACSVRGTIDGDLGDALI